MSDSISEYLEAWAKDRDPGQLDELDRRYLLEAAALLRGSLRQVPDDLGERLTGIRFERQGRAMRIANKWASSVVVVSENDPSPVGRQLYWLASALAAPSSDEANPAPPTSGDSEADELIRSLGFAPERFRTEAGFINHSKLRAAIRNPQDYEGLMLHTTPGQWVPIKPEGAPYWGIHTATGETVAGTSSGLCEGDARLICELRNASLEATPAQAGAELPELQRQIDELERLSAAISRDCNDCANQRNAANARVREAEWLLRAALAYLPPIDHQDQTRQRIAAFLAASGETK